MVVSQDMQVVKSYETPYPAGQATQVGMNEVDPDCIMYPGAHWQDNSAFELE